MVSKKQVKFLSPIVIDEDEQRRELEPGFWDGLHQDIEVMPADDRSFNVNLAPYLGEAGAGSSIRRKYIRVGRIRRPADWPETVDESSGTTGPLSLPPGRNLFEAAYIVPFGTKNRIAFMGPLRGIVTIRTLEMWLGQVMDLPLKNHRLELVPEVDLEAFDKLIASDGVNRLQLRLPAGAMTDAEIGDEEGADAAFRELSNEFGDDLSIEITLSPGHSTAPTDTRERLKAVTQWLVRSNRADKVKATFTNWDGEEGRLKREEHDLIRDVITATAEFGTDDETKLDVDDILEEIDRLINDFGK